jgi:hypothetical protein
VREPSSRPFFVALGGMALVVVIGVGLLVYNIVDHALNHTTTTPVRSVVTSVHPGSPSEITVTATVTSLGLHEAQVTCLVGVVLPADPLAYPSRVQVELAPGQTRTVSVTRSLIKPDAWQVRIDDVAFKCT